MFSFNSSGLASSNLVNMTADLLMILPQNPMNYELIEEILKTLMKYSLGPCTSNQQVLSLELKFFH